MRPSGAAASPAGRSALVIFTDVNCGSCSRGGYDVIGGSAVGSAPSPSGWASSMPAGRPRTPRRSWRTSTASRARRIPSSPPREAPTTRAGRALSQGHEHIRGFGRVFECCKTLQIGRILFGYPRRAVPRRLLLACLVFVAALVGWPSAVSAQTDSALSRSDLLERRPVHSARAGLDSRRARAATGRPVPASTGALERVECSARTVSAMQKRLSTQATSVGVNGDYSRSPMGGRAGFSCATACS